MSEQRASARCSCAVLVALLLPLGLGIGPAQAQAGRARAQFERGVAEASAHRWAEALEAFRDSYEALPRGRTLFNVAVALDRLGRGPECLETVDRLLERDDISEQERAEAIALRERWGSRVAALVVRTWPREAQVEIDGTLRDGERSYHAPGPHVVEVRAAGHRAEQRRVHLRANDEAVLEVALAPLGETEGAVALRPLDRATVAVVAMRGAERAVDRAAPRAATSGGYRAAEGTVRVRSSHGSAVAVGDGRNVLTARHLVEGADVLVVLRSDDTRALAARVVWTDVGHDLALLSVSEPVAAALELDPPRLSVGDPVELCSYPDPAVPRPLATRATLAGAGGDGRVQLSVGRAPGPGAPVTRDGRLLGVVSRPSPTAPGVVIVEPISSVLEAVRAAASVPRAAPRTQPSDQVLAELVGRAPAGEVTRRLGRLRVAATAPPDAARAALFWIEAASARAALLEDAGLTNPAMLPSDQLRDYRALAELEATFAAIASGDPRIASRYGVPVVALPPPPDDPSAAPEPGLVSLALGFGGLLLGADSGPFGGAGLGHARLYVGKLGLPSPFRVDLMIGVAASAGAWRDEPIAAGFLEGGASLRIGSQQIAFALELAYAPGVLWAEQATTFSFASMRLGLGLWLDPVLVMVSWREVGRPEADTMRAAELTVGFEVF